MSRRNTKRLLNLLMSENVVDSQKLFEQLITEKVDSNIVTAGRQLAENYSVLKESNKNSKDYLSLEEQEDGDINKLKGSMVESDINMLKGKDVENDIPSIDRPNGGTIEESMKGYSYSETVEFFEFLDDLRDSGRTNMFGAGEYLEHEYGLPRREASEILTSWMKSFDGGNEDVGVRASEALDESRQQAIQITEATKEEGFFDVMGEKDTTKTFEWLDAHFDTFDNTKAVISALKDKFQWHPEDSKKFIKAWKEACKTKKSIKDKVKFAFDSKLNETLNIRRSFRDSRELQEKRRRPLRKRTRSTQRRGR